MSIRKKLVALCVTCLILVCTATSAFAADTYYYYRITGPTPLRLSAGLSGQTVTTNTNVLLDTDREAWRQQWKHVSTANGTAWVCRQGESQNLALNINRSNNNCNVHSWKDNTPADYVVTQMDPIGIPLASKIALWLDPNWLTIQTENGSYVGANLIWGSKYLYFRELPS